MLVFANSRRLTGRNGNGSILTATRFMPAETSRANLA